MDFRRFKKLLSLGSQTAPRIADDVVESKALQKKLSSELVEDTPKVIGKGKSRASTEYTGETPYADFTDVTDKPKSLWDKLDKKKAAAVLGLTTAGGMYLGSGDNEPIATPIPDENQTKEPILPENYNQLAIDEANSQSEPNPEITKKNPVKTEEPKKDGLDLDAQVKKEDAEKSVDFEKMMQDALDTKSRDDWEANLLRASENIAAGFRGGKADYSGSQEYLKQSKERAEGVGKKILAAQQQQQYNKAKSELDDENAMRNPNSEISKLVSDLAQKTGLIKPGQQISAMSLKNSGVNLGVLLSTIEAAKARKEAAALAKEIKVKEKEQALTEKQRKFIQGLRKEATTGVLGKQYSTYATGQRMSESLSEFSKNPSGYKDYATLMGGLKALQGDESVVREAEVRLGMSAVSAIDAAYNYLQKAATGKMLNDNQRKEMVNTIKILTDASKKQYMYSVQPILEQASIEGIDPKLVLSGSLSSAAESAPAQQSVETKEFNQQNKPGSIVTTKSGKRYKIGQDGKTGTLIQ